MKVLLTGGAGYIGSHACVELIEAGHKVSVIDNLSNSSEEALRRIEKITGVKPFFTKADLLDKGAIERLFASVKFDAVIHFAGLKAVGESVSVPLKYFHNNLTGTIDLLDVMGKYGCKTLVFSSSATVYGDPDSVPINESSALRVTNPYGRTKLIIEDMLRDLAVSDPEWKIAILRYFNPVGAHPSGLIGENPRGIPNNLMPFIAQVATGKREFLTIYGSDYKTPDGTGVRDYIHVVDLCKGHLKALEKIADGRGVKVWNLGTGRGNSVLEMFKAFEIACGKTLPYKIAARRPGDIAQCYADPRLASEELGWKAELGIERMCADTWNWQSRNPDGYKD